MLRIAKNSKRKPEEIMVIATAFFGPQGTGLKIKPRGENSVEFFGGGGFVLLEITPDEAGSEVEIQTREWEYDVKQFLQEI